MTAPLPQPVPIAGRHQSTGPVAGSADWLRLARLARLLSWLTLAWMGIEGGVAITAAVAAGSIALLGFGLDSGIEAMASAIVIWRFTGTRPARPRSGTLRLAVQFRHKDGQRAEGRIQVGAVAAARVIPPGILA